MGAAVFEPRDESEAVDNVREDDPDDAGGVMGVEWNGAGWPMKPCGTIVHNSYVLRGQKETHLMPVVYARHE